MHAYSDLSRSYHYDEDEFIVEEFFTAPDRKHDEKDIMLLSQGDVGKVLEGLPDLCESWQGPLNIAVYNEKLDLQQTICYLTNVRNCNPCLKKWLSLHLVTKNTRRQTELNIYKGSCSSTCQADLKFPEQVGDYISTLVDDASNHVRRLV